MIHLPIQEQNNVLPWACSKIMNMKYVLTSWRKKGIYLLLIVNGYFKRKWLFSIPFYDKYYCHNKLKKKHITSLKS